MADRYTIDVERYIPPGPLRDLARGLGATDLSNFNPVTGFVRGRDAMARGDYADAAIESAAPLAGLGILPNLARILQHNTQSPLA